MYRGGGVKNNAWNSALTSLTEAKLWISKYFEDKERAALQPKEWKRLFSHFGTWVAVLYEKRHMSFFKKFIYLGNPQSSR